MSLAAAALLLSVLAWRFGIPSDPLPKSVLALIPAWILVTLIWSRRRLRQKTPPDAIAAAGLDYYRAQLEQRRSHLRNEWLWHGPAVLACLVFLAEIRNSPLRLDRMAGILPFILILAVWIAFGIRRRWNQARRIQQELDELNRE